MNRQERRAAASCRRKSNARDIAYRHGVDYDKMMADIKAVCDAGGQPSIRHIDRKDIDAVVADCEAADCNWICIKTKNGRATVLALPRRVNGVLVNADQP